MPSKDTNISEFNQYLKYYKNTIYCLRLMDVKIILINHLGQK